MFSLLYRPFDVTKVGFVHDEFHYRGNAKGSVKRCTFIPKSTRDFECYCDMYYGWTESACWVNNDNVLSGNFEIAMWVSSLDIQEAINARTDYKKAARTIPEWVKQLFGGLHL